MISSALFRTLGYLIEVQARLLILKRNSPLHSLMLVWTFIDFEKIHTPPYSNSQLIKQLQYRLKTASFWHHWHQLIYKNHSDSFKTI